MNLRKIGLVTLLMVSLCSCGKKSESTISQSNPEPGGTWVAGVPTSTGTPVTPGGITSPAGSAVNAASQKPGVSATPGAAVSPGVSTSPAVTAKPGAAKPAANALEAISTDYVVKDNEQDIRVKLPRLSNLQDKSKQDRINQWIRAQVQKRIGPNPDPGNYRTYEAEYTVKYLSPELLSIAFSYYESYKMAAHPAAGFYAINLDITKEASIPFNALIQVDDNFIQVVKTSKYQMSARGEFNLEGYPEQMIPGDFKEVFKTYDDQFYFTKDSLGISLPVAHAAGDFWNGEIKFSIIPRNIKKDGEIWKSLFRFGTR